jgi:hypothetical protein
MIAFISLNSRASSVTRIGEEPSGVKRLSGSKRTTTASTRARSSQSYPQATPQRATESVSIIKGAPTRIWTSRKGTRVRARLSGLGPKSAVLVKTDGSKITIARSALSDSDKLSLGKCDAVNSAIQNASSEEYYEKAIAILVAAEQDHPDAFNIGQVITLRQQYERDVQFELQQLEKGLVKYRGRWMTPKQKQEAAVENYISETYGASALFFHTEEDASRSAMDFNRLERAFVENRKTKVNLWLEYGMAGAAHPGAAVTFHMAKVAYDRDLKLWVRYLVVLQTF